MKLNICYVHLFLLAKITKNELVLSLYSLSSKTSRYAHFGHNQLTVYGIRLAAFILPLRQKFEFQNIRHAIFHIRIAACEIRIVVYHIWLATYYSNCYSEICSKFTVWPQNFIKLYYDPKRYESFQIGLISKFLNNTLSIPKLSKIMIWSKIVWNFSNKSFCKISSNTCWFESFQNSSN